MDDFFGEVEDERAEELRMAAKDRERVTRQVTNAGYLAGLEWAEGAYLEAVLEGRGLEQF